MKKTRKVLTTFSIRKVLATIPEYYLIVLVFLSGYTPPLFINPFAIGLALLLVLQIIFKVRVTGLMIAGLFIVINLFMLGALISEFNEFKVFNAAAKALLLGGSGILILNLLTAAAMIFKYTRTGNWTNLQTQASL